MTKLTHSLNHARRVFATVRQLQAY